MYNSPISNFASSNSFKDLIRDLLQAWHRYIRWSVRNYLSGKSPHSLVRIMRLRATLAVIILFLATMSILCLIRATAYGQDELILAPSGWLIAVNRFFPWVIGSSFLGIFIRFTRRKYPALKRVFDFLAASLGLILLSPLFLIVSILLRIDSPGPVFFKQDRVGKDGKIFNMWKFRTMRVEAELETGPVWAAQDDPRITRLGRFLRKSHIDELPQLINVFKGEMSLIGPRPERMVFVEKINGCVPHYQERLRVRPGITGLAQVRYSYGASIKDAARKLKYDILYIQRMCWMLDLRILFLTVGRVLTGEGAR